MNDSLNHGFSLPREQQAIRDKCFHPSGTFVEFPIEDVETSIPERFKKIVRTYPERVAVKAGSQAVTYFELDAMANRVAHRILIQCPVEPEPVGILLEKGIEQIAAIIGVLKEGKFFVLLDPAFPQSRIAAILDDSETKVVICDGKHVAAATEITTKNSRQFLPIDGIDDTGLTWDLRVKISPHDYAYLVYTSGSTGQPKAVIQTHRNLLHRMMVYSIESGVDQDDRIAVLPSNTANAVANTFNGLLTGATLCPFDVKKEGIHRLADWLDLQNISICSFSSPLFRSLCQILEGSEHFPQLRFLRITSESAYSSDVDLFKKHFSANCMLVNGLSSSETGPLCAYFIHRDTEIVGTELPVGYPLWDKEILLFDNEGRELGPNQVGEIVVRSRYLSPGYWRRPDLTMEKFRPDLRDPEKRLYYTGDLGLMLPDGCLIHKGRKDFRIKIRGYGVDLIEVEKTLLSCANVKETVVVSRTEGSEAQLIAYYTTQTEPSPTVSEFREFLRKTLADYMIPAAFVKLDALPLTVSGKVDRNALPDRDKTRPELTVSYVAPRTTIEEKLAKIWAEVLTVDRVGLHDSFFDLGGHSLAASRVISRVIQTFQLELPVKALFDAPTVAEMATIITQNQTKRASDAELEQMLGEIEAMTEAEVEKQLAGESARSSKGDGHE